MELGVLLQLLVVLRIVPKTSEEGEWRGIGEQGEEGLRRKRDSMGIYCGTWQHSGSNNKVIKGTRSMENAK